MRAGGAVARDRGAATHETRRFLSRLLPILLGCTCACRSFGPVAAPRAALARRAWDETVARASVPGDANLLYEAAISQGVLRTSGTLAVRLRGQLVEGTLAGAFGSTLATYSDGELRGEKIAPVRLPARQLRAVLAGFWLGEPEVTGERGSRVRLLWSGSEPGGGVFDVDRGQLDELSLRRPDGELEVRYSGTRAPWPENIEIDEKRTGSKLRLKLLSREALP